jgi:hypothetical protein
MKEYSNLSDKIPNVMLILNSYTGKPVSRKPFQSAKFPNRESMATRRLQHQAPHERSSASLIGFESNKFVQEDNTQVGALVEVLAAAMIVVLVDIIVFHLAATIAVHMIEDRLVGDHAMRDSIMTTNHLNEAGRHIPVLVDPLSNCSTRSSSRFSAKSYKSEGTDIFGYRYSDSDR